MKLLKFIFYFLLGIFSFFLIILLIYFLTWGKFINQNVEEKFDELLQKEVSLNEIDVFLKKSVIQGYRVENNECEKNYSKLCYKNRHLVFFLIGRPEFPCGRITVFYKINLSPTGIVELISKEKRSGVCP